MMTPAERIEALTAMQTLSDAFYLRAMRIGNHPFIEFTGLINEYIKACHAAHEQGIDFTDCSAHSGLELPLRAHHVDYINEKLECIYGGRIRVVNAASAVCPGCQTSFNDAHHPQCAYA